MIASSLTGKTTEQVDVLFIIIITYIITMLFLFSNHNKFGRHLTNISAINLSLLIFMLCRK